MNKYFKYIISFLLGFIIYFLLKNNLEEGFSDDAFVLLSRIIGETDEGDNRTEYTGCQNYICDNKTYTYDYLNSISDSELIDLAFKYIDKDYSVNNFYEIFNKEFDTNLTKENYTLKLRVNNKQSYNSNIGYPIYRKLENVILHRREKNNRRDFFRTETYVGILSNLDSQIASSVCFYSDKDTWNESNLVIIQNESGFIPSLFLKSYGGSIITFGTMDYTNKGAFYSGSVSRSGAGLYELDHTISIEFLFESTTIGLTGLEEDKNNIIRNIIKKTKSQKFVSKDYDSDNIDYLTCNNEPGNLSSSSLGKKCNHEICCFNTNCNSLDSKSANNLDMDERRRLGFTVPENRRSDLLDGQCEENSCNGGECVKYNEDKYYCNCPEGLGGNTCNTTIQVCAVNHCSDKCYKNNSWETGICFCYDFLVPMVNGEENSANIPGSYCGRPVNTCPEGTKIKKDSNCRSIEGCQNNYVEFCCSDSISDDLQLFFNTLDADGDGFINLEELTTYINLLETREIVQSQTSESSDNIYDKLNKLLTKTQDENNVKLDIYDLNDLFNE